MAEEKKSKKPRSTNALVGRQAKPTVIDSTTKLDIDTNKAFIDSLIEAGLNSTLDATELENFTSISNSRDQIYQLIDTMAKDSTVSAIIRTYTEDVCEMADNGHIVWCESADPKVSKFVNYLLNVMNVDKNIYSWVYCLIKYGDVYLRLYRESDYEDALFNKGKVKEAELARNTKLNEKFDPSEQQENLNENIILNVHKSSDPYSYYVEMVPDPCTMFELVKFGITYGFIETPNMPSKFDNSDTFAGNYTGTTFNYRVKSNDINIYQADDFVHACLDDNFTRFPETIDIFTNDKDYETHTNAKGYNVRRGKSLLYDSYKIWREKSLLENSILLNRITKSSVVRKVQVEVGDMPKEQSSKVLRRVKELFEQKTALNPGSSMTEYNNPGPIENNIYFTTHNGQGAISVESVGGDIDVKNLADLDNWTNKFYSSYGIPKQYFGWTDDGAGFNGGSSLTILSSVYAKGVKRVQNAMLQAITDVINLILVNKGFKSYLNNFVLKMKTPLTQEEKDYREDLTNRVSAISNLQGLFSDIEDKGRRLSILKVLVSTLNYGDEITALIQEEIKAAEEAKKAEEEAAAAEALAEKEAEANTDSSSAEEQFDGETEEEDLDLEAMPDEALESFKADESKQVLTEDSSFLMEDDLPTPDELNKEIDFSENK